MRTKIKITTLTLILFAAVFMLLRYPMFQVKADTATSTATVTNIIPIASNVSIDGGAAAIALTEGTTKTVTVTADVTDNNGCEDIGSVTVKLYETVNGADADDDENDHYTAIASQDEGSCITGGEDLTASYTATFSVYYYADPTDESSHNSTTDWTSQAVPFDEATGTAATSTIEMSTLTALDVTAAISYGTLALNGDTGTGDATTTVTNTGNENIDVKVDGYGATDGDGKAMICTFGSIPIADEKYATSTGVDYALRNSLSDTAAEVDMDIAPRTTDVTTGDFYWGLGLPVTGVGGTCSGIVVFTAWSDPNTD